MRLTILIILLTTSAQSFSGENYFLNIRTGYIVNQSDDWIIENGERFDAEKTHPWRVNVSAGYKPKFCRKNKCKFGVSHESSPASGSFFGSYDQSNEQVFFEFEF